MSGPRAEKYCYECATVLPRTAITCWSCSAPQPELPQSTQDPPSRPPGTERPCASCGRSILVRAEICVHCGVRQPPAPAPAPQPAELAATANAPAPPFTADWDVSHAMLVVGALLMVLMAMMSMRGDAIAPSSIASASSTPGADPAAPEPASVTETQAWAEARRQVVQHLRAPPDVLFSSEHNTRRLGPERFEVTSHFEMPNTAGKLVRTDWLIVLARVRGAWQIERLEAKN